ncbi:hypothetical protein EON81_18495, partial [bacterium]
QPGITGPTPVPVADLKKAGRANDKRRYFLFTQLGRFFRSAVSPVTAMDQLSTQMNHPGLKRALIEGKEAMAAGKPLSDTFAEYPGLFPPDIVGTLKTGESTGELADACDRIAAQAMASHALRRQLFFYGLILFLTVCLYPFILGVIRGSLGSMSEQDKAGGTLPVMTTLMKHVRLETARIAPSALACGAVFALVWHIWHLDRFRLQRHRLVLSLPILGKRAWAESMARFGWALSSMSKGGATARQAFEIAAETPPNAWLAHQLQEIARSMGEADKMSGTLERTGIFPAETIHIVSNGEMAGDLPGAIMSTARAAEAEFSARDSSWAQLSRFLFYIPMGILTLLMAISLYGALYGGIMKQLLPTE